MNQKNSNMLLDRSVSAAERNAEQWLTTQDPADQATLLMEAKSNLCSAVRLITQMANQVVQPEPYEVVSYDGLAHAYAGRAKGLVDDVTFQAMVRLHQTGKRFQMMPLPSCTDAADMVETLARVEDVRDVAKWIQERQV